MASVERKLIVTGQGSREITVGKPGGEYVLEIKDGKNGCLDYDTIRVSEVEIHWH
ncbi:MAG: hypothetical protein IPQ10_10735 [Saprospiraceae bacterium]|nr:hypothetical protein [Saprospiraceae bacterium]